MSDAADERDPKHDRMIGEILANRYQIEERLGEGAMGSVYRARHVKVGRPFAVKVLHKKLLEDKKVAQRFEREAELAGRLRHPNVVGVVDVGETTDGLRYMVMDFAEGDDLATLLNEAPMKPERVLHLTKQMLEGLYHAHEAGLIHRDFKPENVIVERDDHGSEIPRIVDFGIAILREGGESASASGRLTTNGLVLGTPHYMAPEQAVADPIDHRIDLFALGIVIYEMLSGKLPFDGSGAEVARANLLLDPPLISQRVPYLEVDPLIEAFARRLMAKKRDLRPATAKAARELLDLIERDRAAAAAALGVPLQASARAPQVTADVVPHRPVNEDSGNFMVPGAAPAAPPDLRASDLEAPPVGRGEAQIRTSPARPLEWSDESPALEAPARSRRGWIVAGVAGAFAAAGIAFVVMRDSGETEAKPEDKVVMQATEPVPTPTPPEPTPTPVADTPVVADTPAEPVDAPEVIDPPVEPPPPIEKPRDRTKKPKQRVTARQQVTQPEPTKPADPPKPVEVVQPAEPKAPQDVSTNALAAQYTQVGKELKALGAKADDLWPRYRRIQFNDALKSQERRNEAATILAQLQKMIASRK